MEEWKSGRDRKSEREKAEKLAKLDQLEKREESGRTAAARIMS